MGEDHRGWRRTIGMEEDRRGWGRTIEGGEGVLGGDKLCHILE